MKITKSEKNELLNTTVKLLQSQLEIEKIIVFGSFIESDNPQDLDLAVFQNSTDTYLTLALKYRKLIRDVSRKIPVDILPIKSEKINAFISQEIAEGKIIYERI